MFVGIRMRQEKNVSVIDSRGGRSRVALSLRRQHRNIEQSLALLRDLLDISCADLGDLASDVAAHLAADENVLYPAVEKASAQVFSAQRAQHVRLHVAITDTVRCLEPGLALRTRIAELASAFAAHARLEEGAMHACLEARMSDEALGMLETKLLTFRAAWTRPCSPASAPPRPAKAAPGAGRGAGR